MQEIGEENKTKMKQLYDNNMKTKNTQTEIRDIKRNLVLERTQEYLRDRILRAVRIKEISLQTDEVSGEALSLGVSQDQLLAMSVNDKKELIYKLDKARKNP